MKLSAQLIVYHLRQHFSVAASSWLSSEPHLEYPVIYQAPGPLTGGKIYISDDPDFLIPSHHLCYPQLVGTIQLSGGRRHVKKYMEFLKNLPGAGSGQPVTCSTSGMGLRLK